jgi:sialate O-acetylesterase
MGLTSRVLGVAAGLCLCASAWADVRVPAMFSDHMVLQRDSRAAVWGWADAGEAVTVTFGGRSMKTTADGNGKWRVELGRMAANAAGQTLTVAGKNTVQFSDVLVGDVWVCSGQSNMGIQVGETWNAADVLPKTSDASLRLLRLSASTSLKPLDDVKPSSGKGRGWVVSEPDSAKVFTAVGYFFGKELRRDLGIPIGLIESDQGGSMAQLWTSVDAIEKNVDADPEFKDWLVKRQAVVDAYPEKMKEYVPAMAAYDQAMKHWWNDVQNTPDAIAKRAHWDIDNKKARAEGKPPLPRLQPSEPRPTPPVAPDGGPYSNFMVGTLYNAMIAPLTPYSIKGITWYQGESNDKNAKQYGVLFPIMIKDWRAHWGERDIPFLFVQLPNINKPATEPVATKGFWAGMREAQEEALKLPMTGMATTIDVGDPYDVHGKDKFDVGYRLGLVGRHVAYGEKFVWRGPVYESMKVKKGSIEITFDNVGGGLVIGAAPWTPANKPAVLESELKGFAIAGDDRVWYYADARIVGKKVELSSKDVAHPVAVRYGWADNPPCNLYNVEKLPATPFRTDRW